MITGREQNVYTLNNWDCCSQLDDKLAIWAK